MKIIAIATLCSAVSLCAPGMPARCHAQSANVTVFASGLAGPRGLKFGPDGDLYVAEAGFGGTNSTTTSQCGQVPAPIGPYKNGNTARISKLDKHGNRTTVASGFPSAVSSDATKDTMGVGDIAFLDGQLALQQPDQLADAPIGGGGKADVGAGRQFDSHQLHRMVGALEHLPAQIAAGRVAPKRLVGDTRQPIGLALGPRQEAGQRQVEGVGEAH